MEYNMKQKSEITRRKIEREFFLLLRKHGYEKTTFTDLSVTCGMSKGHICFYYKRKEDLLWACAKNFFNNVQTTLNSFICLPDDSVLKFFSEQLLSFFVTSNIIDANKTIAELVESFNYAKHKSIMNYDYLCLALNKMAIEVNGDILLGCISATHSAHAILHNWITNCMPVDFRKLFVIFSDTLFLHFTFADAHAYAERALQLFDEQNPALLAAAFGDAESRCYLSGE